MGTGVSTGQGWTAGHLPALQLLTIHRPSVDLLADGCHGSAAQNHIHALTAMCTGHALMHSRAAYCMSNPLLASCRYWTVTDICKPSANALVSTPVRGLTCGRVNQMDGSCCSTCICRRLFSPRIRPGRGFASQRGRPWPLMPRAQAAPTASRHDLLAA